LQPNLEIKVNFISPAKVGRVLGTGRIVSRGRSICFLEGQLHDDQGKLLATAMATSKIGRVVGKTEDV
jgi:acyl-coenzyme A thioesterase PaaI-like protein